ncbi:MAG: hypothetical protein VCB25_08970, partial [Myxococcota bacterium]
MSPEFKFARIVIAVCVTGLACDAREPFDRLVDSGQRSGSVSSPAGLLLEAPSAASSREGGASSLSTATIDHDTRNVLAAHPHQILGSREGVRATEPDLVVYKASVAGLFPEGE